MINLVETYQRISFIFRRYEAVNAAGYRRCLYHHRILPRSLSRHENYIILKVLRCRGEKTLAICRPTRMAKF